MINKGVDRPPIVWGIRGMNYLTYLGLAAVVLLIVFVSGSMLIGIPVSWGFGTYLMVLALMYSVLSVFSKKYGERGLLKEIGIRRKPEVVMMRSSSIFPRIISGSVHERKLNDMISFIKNG